jgi:hypothetical protein
MLISETLIVSSDLANYSVLASTVGPFCFVVRGTTMNIQSVRRVISRCEEQTERTVDGSCDHT